jgi:2-polyprenyl-3-methyl-5-hydroxy-6-metoxy-1,4-benzoquinol methylase
MVWASKTDYASLYTADYFGKHSGIASFDVNKFPRDLAKVCEEIGCIHVVDVGSGSGILAESLRELGLQVFACDYDPAHSGAIHLRPVMT